VRGAGKSWQCQVREWIILLWMVGVPYIGVNFALGLLMPTWLATPLTSLVLIWIIVPWAVRTWDATEKVPS
jgi:hypothetical protein